MRFLIAGASGFLGNRLRESLVGAGHDVTSLVRRPAAAGPAEREAQREAPKKVQWDPYAGVLDPALVEKADVVVNLAGSPTLGNPHSKRWAEQLLTSRVTTTRVLAEAIASSGRRPAFLAGNGISFYGDHADEPVTEASESRGDAFLTRVTTSWQAAAQPAVDAGARVCILRTAPVMDRSSAPLRQLMLLFKAGLGGRIGGGGQYFPMISLQDWLAAVAFVAEHADMSGPVNLCCPETPTNADFTRALAALVHRPAIIPVPAVVLRPAAGRMSPELLGSVRAVPQALLDAGFRFADQTVADVLASASGTG